MTKIKSRGASHALVVALTEADGSLPWVELGRLCLAQGVSVAALARRLGVSRQTLYTWFFGKTVPTPAHVKLINSVIAEYHSAKL